MGAAGIGFGAANAVQSYMNFEQQMSKVQAVRRLSKDSEEMQALVEQAKNLGAETAWTRQQVGEAQYYQSMAGWDTQQILNATPAILNLASAGGTDLGTTADILTDTMTGFQLKAGEMYRDSQGNLVEASQHYADVMAATVTNSNTDISQLGEALKYSAAAIGAMYAGKDVQTRMHATEDAMVMTGLMSNAGIKGSQAGTSTRAVFSRFGAENRNAKFALDALGVDFTDQQTGEVRRVRDIMGDLRRRFNEGGDVEQFANFAEEMSGQKLNADTRRKLDSFLKSVQERGGEMTGADRLKMASMLAGQEAMSGFLAAMLGDWDSLAGAIDNAHGAAEQMAKVQLDNLAGDITILGSAWDAFQQDLIEGDAASGLRSFVQTLTEIVNKANGLFKDGIQLGDFGKIIFDVVDRLRSKFMELDGIGSILAGGVLMGALAKIGAKIRSLVTSFRDLRNGSVTSTGTSATSRGSISTAQSVGTMTVNAGVVNVNGKAGAPRNVGNQSIIDRYNQTKERIRGGGTPPPAPSRFAGARSAGLMGAGLASVFGVMDVMGVKEHSAQRLTEAQDTVTYHQNQLQNMIRSGASREQIDAQRREVADAQAFVQRTEQLNREEELRAGAGATGSVAGTALGTAIGTLGGPVGMMLGGMLGGMLGDALGQKIADMKLEQDKSQSGRTDYFAKSNSRNVPASMGNFRQDTQPEKVSVAQKYLEQVAARQREESSREQIERFQNIDSQLGVSSPFRNSETMYATQDFYQQQFTGPNPDAQQYEFKNPFADFEFENPFEGFEFENPFANLFEGFEPPELDFGSMIESASAQISELGTSFSEGLTTAFESASTSLDGFGETISTALTTAFESASTTFDGLGEMISAGLEGAASSAESALSTIQSTFDSAREGIVSAWSEIPGIFGGIFDGLGGVASAAGSAILSGLTSVCGAVISAWEGVSSTVSSIIAGIQAAASSVGSLLPSIGGGVGKAEGGFVGSETHFYAGEHGPEVVIPLSSNQRSRALDLYEKTGQILNSETQSFGNDEIKSARDEYGNRTDIDVPEFDRVTGDETLSVRRDKLAAQETLLPDKSVVQTEKSSSSNEIQLGGVTVNFNISGDNPSEILSTIREHLNELTDQIAARLSEQISNVNANQPLEA